MEKKGNVVLLPVPLQGHLNPIIHLVHRLVSFSCFKVTVIVPASDGERVKKNFENNSGSVEVLCLPPEVLDMRNMKSRSLGASFLMEILEICEAAQGAVEELVKQLPLVKCIIADLLFLGWAQDLANKLNVPRIAFSTSSAATLAAILSTSRLFSEGYVPIKDEAEELPEYFIPGIRKLKLRDLPTSIANLRPTDPMYEKRIRIYARLKEAAYILTNTVDELEGEIVAAGGNVLSIGPLLPPAYYLDGPAAPGRGEVSHSAGIWEEDIACLNWLDKQAPSSVLYVSFGSLATISEKQTEQILTGLLDASQKFLWVIRPNLISGDFSRDAIKQKTKDAGLIISWAPQLDVLKHTSIGGFLTHCGWNSTLESISSGVPMLCWPCFSEQHLNCKFIVDEWKIGLRFTKGKDGLVEHEEIKRVVTNLIVGDEAKRIKKNATNLKDAIRKAVKEGGSSYNNLLSFSNTFE